MICAHVREDKLIAIASGLSDRTDAKAYNNLLIAPVCICTLCIARCLTLNMGISMKGAIMVHCIT